MFYCSSKPYTYKFISKVLALPVSLAEVRTYVKVPEVTDISDADLTLLINAASNFFECFTNTYLITTTFKLFLDCFPSCQELRRSRLQSIEFVKYFDTDDAEQTLSSDNYYETDESCYSQIIFINSLPQVRGRLQDISIQFKVGFGESDSDIPDDIKLGLMQHVNAMYQNRGDCIDEFCSNLIPIATKMTYNKYKIIEIGA